MKLVDILARELKVWPEGECFAWQDFDRWVRFSDSNRHDFFACSMAEDNIRYQLYGNPKSGVNRAEWQAAVDALNAPAVWDGEGRPPVGTVCEAQIPSKLNRWERCEIVWHHPDSDGSAAVVHGDVKLLSWSSTFRAIRTPEQIAAEAEERINAIVEMKGHLSFSDYKEVERHCANLYDAGYRKQVAK